MRPVLTVGSVAFDSVKTPSGEVSRVVGGAATFFSVAASFFTEVRLVAVVGDAGGWCDMASAQPGRAAIRLFRVGGTPVGHVSDIHTERGTFLTYIQ